MAIERLELEGAVGIGVLLLEFSSGSDSRLLLESSGDPDLIVRSLHLLGVGLLINILLGVLGMRNVS